MSDITWDKTVQTLKDNFKGIEVELLRLTDWFCENHKKLSTEIRLSNFIEAAKAAGVKVV